VVVKPGMGKGLLPVLQAVQSQYAFLRHGGWVPRATMKSIPAHRVPITCWIARTIMGRGQVLVASGVRMRTRFLSNISTGVPSSMMDFTSPSNRTPSALPLPATIGSAFLFPSLHGMCSKSCRTNHFIGLGHVFQGAFRVVLGDLVSEPYGLLSRCRPLTATKHFPRPTRFQYPLTAMPQSSSLFYEVFEVPHVCDPPAQWALALRRGL
jgi:hypothetical protein